MSEVRTPTKRLVDLNPKWKLTTDGEVWGIEYDCPCGLPSFDPDGLTPDQYKAAWEQTCKVMERQIVPTKSNFAGLPTCADSIARGWDLSGDSFETVTLSPSIHAVGHWHGFIRAGWLESC